MATPPSFGDGDGDGDDMKASLWSELQSFIDLSIIYAKLPLAPFFRLRQVCKEWNRLASDRQFLESNFNPPLSSNPYFVFTRPNGRHVLLTSDGSSWSSTPLPRVRCEVSGLLLEDSNRNLNRVFDLHTRVFHTLPPLPAVVQEAPVLPVEEEDDYADPLTLMTVDTTLTPYTFRVVIADEIIGTRIYDSKSATWVYKPSTHEYSYPALGTSCIHYKKVLYIRVGVESDRVYDFLTYDLERDEWDSRALESLQDKYMDIGMWQDRWLVIAMNDFSGADVLECHSNFEKPWTFFDSIPRDLYVWMANGLVVDDDVFEYLCIMSKFCGEHLLLYSNMEEDRAVLYNLDRKTWDKIELPATLVSPK